VQAARGVAERVRQEPDVLNNNWIGGAQALAELLGFDQLDRQVTSLVALSREVQRVAGAQPTVVRVPAPAKLFGDVHGQLRDLLKLFAHFGFPDHHGGDVETCAYVFNGDWVDRGRQQEATVALLFALKCLYPARVFLVRGNHEFKSQSRHMGQTGFENMCRLHLGPRWGEAYDAIHSAFEWLPLAANVGGEIAVMHGGIGDGSWTLQDLQSVSRPVSESESRHIYVVGPDRQPAPVCVVHALWSDPTQTDDEQLNGAHPNPERGYVAPRWGPDITAAFCHANRVQLVVRSHQFPRAGYKFMHSGHLCTLFSARNYSGTQQNDCALLLVAHDEAGALRVRSKVLRKM
jgi:diadenosine tetraphosphatase ApaH/serine/threonine PP2A family protein phosphatase